MSDRGRLDAARRRGKRAFWDGTGLDANPLRARDSRRAWENAWRDEQRRAAESARILGEQARRTSPTNGDRP